MKLKIYRIGIKASTHNNIFADALVIAETGEEALVLARNMYKSSNYYLLTLRTSYPIKKGFIL